MEICFVVQVFCRVQYQPRVFKFEIRMDCRSLLVGYYKKNLPEDVIFIQDFGGTNGAYVDSLEGYVAVVSNIEFTSENYVNILSEIFNRWIDHCGSKENKYGNVARHCFDTTR